MLRQVTSALIMVIVAILMALMEWLTLLAAKVDGQTVLSIVGSLQDVEKELKK